MDSEQTLILQQAMDRAVADGVFPGGVLLAARGDDVLAVCQTGKLGQGPFDRPVTRDTVYDLASMTKILSTTILCMLFVQEGLVDIDRPLADFWNGNVPADKAGLTVAQLLAHESGYPAWRPFYEEWKTGATVHNRRLAIDRIMAEPFEIPAHTRAIYSDLNFILLGLILETIGGDREDRLFDRYIAEPLGIELGCRPVGETGDQALDRVAPTEDVPRRGGVIWGEVHDDNARALQGVAGHAGLFGCVEDVWRIFRELRWAYRREPGASLVNPDLVRLFWEYQPLAPKSTRALGFDRPSEERPSAGRHFSKRSVGHLGFTGTSLWYDPEKDFTMILLTNRVHPSADNIAIRQFRPHIHDLAFESLAMV